VQPQFHVLSQSRKKHELWWYSSLARGTRYASPFNTVLADFIGKPYTRGATARKRLRLLQSGPFVRRRFGMELPDLGSARSGGRTADLRRRASRVRAAQLAAAVVRRHVQAGRGLLLRDALRLVLRTMVCSCTPRVRPA